MYCTKKLTDDLMWIGGSDRRIELFENAFPINRGISYNSYLLNDEKTVVFDSVDKAISHRFLENLEHGLNGKHLDYIVVNHMEPDHCATIDELVRLYPEVKIVCNARTVGMLKQFFDFDVDSKTVVVKEGDTLNTGKHTLAFYLAPMVHWPEVMVTYDQTDKILFSADAFGTFGAINGNIFADEIEFEKEWLSDARRYYTNIVGKYGTQVLALLKKAESLDVSMICPLHGPVWRENIGWYIDKYKTWASYTPEEKGVVIAYASVYGNTENAVDILASYLAENGVKNIKIFDVSKTHHSNIIAECFRYSHLVFASITYNGGIFSNMESLLLDLKAHNIQNRTVAVIENGSWAATCGKHIKEIMASCKNINVIDESVLIKSSLKAPQEQELRQLADKICETM